MSDLEHALELIEVAMGLTAHGRLKAETFYTLASRAKGGCIIELGCYHGIGTIPLAMAAKVPVYAVDDYVEKRGWAGGYYGPEDEEKFHSNTAGLDVTLVRGEVDELSIGWAEPASLIIWDLGVRDRMLDTFLLWDKHLISGGTFAFRDTDNRGLGSRVAVARALAIGYHNDTEWPGYIWSVQKN